MVVTRRWTNSLPHEYAKIPLRRVESLLPFSFIFVPPNIGEVENILRKEDFDVVHVHHAFTPLSISTINAAKKLRLPVVLTAHTDMFTADADYLWRPMSYVLYPYRRFLGKVDKVIAVSKVAADFISNFVDGTSIEVIPNGVDTNRFRPIPAGNGNFSINGFQILSQEKPIVLFVGRLAFRKGVLLLPIVASMLAKEFPNLQLLVCGKGYMQMPVQALTNIYRLNGRVKMLGFVPDDVLPSLYGLADAVVAPSLFGEAFGIPLIEAMASGKPVVATKVGGIPEVVRNGVTGLLVREGSSAEMTEALRFILSNTEEYIKMSRAARELAVKKYCWSNVVKRIEDAYREVSKAK